MKNRRLARELVLQLLYQRELASLDEEVSSDPEKLLEGITLTGSAGGFCKELIGGVLVHIEELDAIIEPYCEHWSIDRMSVVDRNILRIGVFELRFLPDIPFKVSIDEAVELAKLFGSEDSGSFINGILDALAKDLNVESSEG
ncbi:MAG: transcription antitermination factor NusB [Thermodesulfobacteriota bacterium]